jgi:bifunctional enzyme CysN/CysC/sulfate adenylyltransferase subunit 1
MLAAPVSIDGFEQFLRRDIEKELLRFTTAGSVDDGKSTLIGRLLHDAKAVYEDQLASVKKSRINRSSGPIDFSLLTDGLRAEREQGITIDVAYRHFSTARGTWPQALLPRVSRWCSWTQ